jgi:transposase InsO family protein
MFAQSEPTPCIEFLDRALTWFADRTVRVERAMSDNGSGYTSHAFAAACAQHQIRHLRTRPYRPRTNGKAERFIQTLLREWAYAVRYETSHRCGMINRNPVSTRASTP